MDLQEQQNSRTFKVVIRSYMSEELCWAAGPSPLIVVFSLSCVCCCAVQLPNFFILIFLNSTFRKKNKCLFKSWAWTCLKAGPFGGFILKARQFTSEGQLVFYRTETRLSALGNPLSSQRLNYQACLESRIFSYSCDHFSRNFCITNRLSHFFCLNSLDTCSFPDIQTITCNKFVKANRKEFRRRICIIDWVTS